MAKQRQRVLVTGAEGQLARCIKDLAADQDFEFLFCDRKTLDITDKNNVNRIIRHFAPLLVINTAAYTQVDRAEEEREIAFAINATAVGHLASACKNQGSALIHLSTDYVFNGSAKAAITEMEQTDPQSVYGSSKLAGEQAIAESGLQQYLIIRTSWLYSQYGTSFYKTMLRLGREKKTLQVVDDQYGCPTNANDLAAAILNIATKTFLTEKTASEVDNEKQAKTGIYHYANAGKTNWFGFASAIFEQAQLAVKVDPVATSAYPTKAKRPAFSVLDTSKIRRNFDLHIPDWKESLLALMKQKHTRNK